MHKDASATFTDATFLAAVGATAPIEMSSEDAAHPNKYFSHTHYCTFQLRKTIAQKTPWRDAGDSRRQSPREDLQHDWLNFDFFLYFYPFYFFGNYLIINLVTLVVQGAWRTRCTAVPASITGVQLSAFPALSRHVLARPLHFWYRFASIWHRFSVVNPASPRYKVGVAMTQRRQAETHKISFNHRSTRKPLLR